MFKLWLYLEEQYLISRWCVPHCLEDESQLQFTAFNLSHSWLTAEVLQFDTPTISGAMILNIKDPITKCI